jgi:FAD:protein FMN transferase
MILVAKPFHSLLIPSGSAAVYALPVLLLLLWAAGCGAPREGQEGRAQYTFNGTTMGTTYTLKIVGPELDTQAQRAIQALVEARLEEINDAMSTYRPDSELSLFNQAMTTDPYPVSPLLMEVMTRAQRISDESGGAFDVTVGHLVDLWGFGPTDEYRQGRPDDSEIAEAKGQIGYTRLHVDPQAGTIAKEMPAMYLDLSAIAKGYGVDHAAAALEHAGHLEYMLEVGGEVRCRGRNRAGAWWRIAIETPVPSQRTPYKVIPLADMAMATSGEYRNFVEQDGQRLSHTIDPTTGRPITHLLASVTVLHQECAMADGYATALMVLGPEKGLEVAERLGLAAFFISHDRRGGFTEAATPEFERYLAAYGSE